MIPRPASLRASLDRIEHFIREIFQEILKSQLQSLAPLPACRIVTDNRDAPTAVPPA